MTNPNKIATMIEWPTLKNVKQLRGFVGKHGTIGNL